MLIWWEKQSLAFCFMTGDDWFTCPYPSRQDSTAAVGLKQVLNLVFLSWPATHLKGPVPDWRWRAKRKRRGGGVYAHYVYMFFDVETSCWIVLVVLCSGGSGRRQSCHSDMMDDQRVWCCIPRIRIQANSPWTVHNNRRSVGVASGWWWRWLGGDSGGDSGGGGRGWGEDGNWVWDIIEC